MLPSPSALHPLPTCHSSFDPSFNHSFYSLSLFFSPSTNIMPGPGAPLMDYKNMIEDHKLALELSPHASHDKPTSKLPSYTEALSAKAQASNSTATKKTSSLRSLFRRDQHETYPAEKDKASPH